MAIKLWPTKNNSGKSDNCHVWLRLYKQVQAKIDEKNSTEADKLKHVRYTDLSEDKYVSKEKYDSELEKLNGLITGKDTEIGNANNNQ